ncbi:MAG TPA: hypothetical protein VEQ85_07120, partial [Lacipirellulaceae bacterium]|nr:hypothetical protein [Lacipirellulaceae bacterium]
LDRPKLAQVLLVTPGNRALELGLSTARVRRVASVRKVSPDVLATADFQVSMQTEAYDLVVFDQCAPATAELMPAANTLFVGRLPPLPAWRTPRAAAVGTAPDAGGAGPAPSGPPGIAAEPPRVVDPQIIDWQRGHPLLNLVELGNVRIVDSLVVHPPVGGKLLVDSTRGPLMSIAPRESYEDAVLGFEIVGRDPSGETTVNTNWPTKHSFPNFCLNLVQYLGEGATELQVQNNRPGEPVELELAQRGRQVSVVLPDKSTRSLRVPATGIVAFNETEQLGVYEVVDGAAPPAEQLAARFAVNLFDRSESDVRVRARQDAQTGLRTVDALAIGYDDVAAESAAAPVRKELWTALLLAALAVLLIEWYIYNRRVFI